MKVHTKSVNGIEVSAYNDSGVDWVVSSKGCGALRFSKKGGFTMKHAIELFCTLKHIA